MFDTTMVRGSMVAVMRTWAVISILLGFVATQVHAATLTTLASFNGSNGEVPMAGLTVSGNTLYGTTEEGGANSDGTVFSIATSGGSPTVLATFNDSNGQYPESSLTLSGNTLYGTTYSGGAYGDGTVFSVATSGGSPSVLATFNGSNGSGPLAGLTLSGNTLYGTTYSGGANGSLYGTVFSVPIGGGSATVLASMNGSSGYWPRACLTVIGNTLYGTASQGGANRDGTLFSVPTSGGTPIVLATFNGSNGAIPQSGLTLSGNTFFGATAYGGNLSVNNGQGDGAVFSVATSGGSPTVLATFNGSNGHQPNAGVTLIGNTLYGTTEYGGAYNDGTVFSVATSGGSPTVLATFNGSNGENPYTGLTLVGNALYGTASAGGANGDGTVFALTLPLATISLINAGNATIITGGSANLGTTVTNSAPAGDNNLNYTLSAAVSSGSAALGAITSGTGSLAPAQVNPARSRPLPPASESLRSLSPPPIRMHPTVRKRRQQP